MGSGDRTMKAKELVKHLTEHYDPDDVIAYDIWTVDDILETYEDCTQEQAEWILIVMDAERDACIGFNWDVVDVWYTESQEEFPKEEA